MAFTNAWDEDVPSGTEDASTCDDYLIRHRVDLGERLEEMLYGFNAASNAAPENDVGVKYLKMYKQTSDPTAVTDFGHPYVKLVSGVPELFYQDDENTALQLTSGGNLKSTANLIIDGTSTLTGNVTCSGTLDVTGNIDPTSYETTNGGFLDEDAMGSNAADKVSSQQAIVAYVAAQIAAENFSAYTIQDSESNTMLKAHAYKAATKGFVYAKASLNAGEFVTGYVGTTDDPAGAGDVVGKQESSGSSIELSIFFAVAKDEYFEITCDRTPEIRWKSVGTLSKPIDQD